MALVKLGSARQRNKKWTRRALDVRALVLSADGGAGQSQGSEIGTGRGAGQTQGIGAQGTGRRLTTMRNVDGVE